MRIIDYQFTENDTKTMAFSKVQLGSINLLVGDTGSGKSRFLNTITNLSKIISQETPEMKTGEWDITFSNKKEKYNWKLHIKLENNKPLVNYEKLTHYKNDSEDIILERRKSEFIFLGEGIPQISRQFTSIQLLKDEEKIHDIYDGFLKINDRRFDADALRDATVLNVLNPLEIENGNTSNRNQYLFSNKININSKLFILKNYFPEKFEEIINIYKEIFPFISDIDICDYSEVNKNYRAPGYTPIFRIKEKYIRNKIDLTQLSSGMKKVLLILTDITILDTDSIYIIDEYENSLGISAIDFLPNYLLQKDNLCQLIITSHHPYLINNFPVKHWYLFSRKGSEINIIPGSVLEKKYSKSKQESFFQLINDPLFTNEQ